MKNKIGIIILLAAAVMTSSCKKYLDIKPKGYVIPQTVEDFERILTNNEFAYMVANDLDMLSDDFTMLDVDMKSLSVDNSSKSRVYQWLPDLYSTPEEMKFSSAWNRMYANIYQFNAIINNIAEASGGTEARKKIALARAKLGRAISYWYLVNLYSKPYNAATADTDPGVPWVTSNDIATPLPGRENINATYAHILKDLNEALPDLPTSATDLYQMTRAAGYGIYARVCLLKGDYTNAALMADNALKFNSNLIDYNTAYNLSNGAYLPVSGAAYTNMMSHPENIFVYHYTYTRGMTVQNVAPSSVDMYEPNDLRRMYANAYSYVSPYTKTQVTCYYYLLYVSFNINIGPTTPEMLLIRAEANARTGKIAAAMEDINLLRSNRIRKDSYVALSAGSQKDAIGKVLLERRKELLFRGVRWFDMRRLNNDPDFGFTARHALADGTTIDLPPNSDRYTLQIPATAITPAITQNP